MTTMIEPTTDWLTVVEVADELGVTTGRVRQWLRQEEGARGARLKGRKFGNTWIVSRNDLQMFLKKERKPGNPDFCSKNAD